MTEQPSPDTQSAQRHALIEKEREELAVLRAFCEVSTVNRSAHLKKYKQRLDQFYARHADEMRDPRKLRKQDDDAVYWKKARSINAGVVATLFVILCFGLSTVVLFGICMATSMTLTLLGWYALGVLCSCGCDGYQPRENGSRLMIISFCALVIAFPFLFTSARCPIEGSSVANHLDSFTDSP